MIKTLMDFENGLGCLYPKREDYYFTEDENQSIKWNREQKFLKEREYLNARDNYNISCNKAKEMFIDFVVDEYNGDFNKEQVSYVYYNLADYDEYRMEELLDGYIKLREMGLNNDRNSKL